MNETHTDGKGKEHHDDDNDGDHDDGDHYKKTHYMFW